MLLRLCVLKWKIRHFCIAMYSESFFHILAIWRLAFGLVIHTTESKIMSGSLFLAHCFRGFYPQSLRFLHSGRTSQHQQFVEKRNLLMLDRIRKREGQREWGFLGIRKDLLRESLGVTYSLL